MNTMIVDPGVIGRSAVIVHDGKCYLATVIDQTPGPNTPKRVRITCDITMQGRVLMPEQYEFKSWADDED